MASSRQPRQPIRLAALAGIFAIAFVSLLGTAPAEAGAHPIRSAAHRMHARGKCGRRHRHRLNRASKRRRGCRLKRADYSNSHKTSSHKTSTSTESSSSTTTATSSTSTTTETATAPLTEGQEATITPGHFRFFSPTSFWNLEPPAGGALDPSSAQLVDSFSTEIEHEIAAGTGPWINTTNYSVPIYTVSAGQSPIRVKLISSFSAPALEAAWNEVPIPPTAQPAQGTDGTLVVWQPSSNRLWEFWRAAHTEEGWQASWGGAMQNVPTGPGVYGPEVWPGAQTWWGSSASSLSIAGGLITLEDLERGEINHALAVAAPEIRAKVYTSPAQRTDGTSTSPTSLPEGVHLRLDPTLNLASLNLPPLTLMIAKAAQRYGIFVRDKAKIVHFFAQDPVSTGTNPYTGPSGYFEGESPAQLLASFPWRRLQVLPMELHESP